MNKRVVFVTLSAVAVAIAIAIPLARQEVRGSAKTSITESGREVSIDVQTDTKKDGMAEVTLIGPPTAHYQINSYSYALPEHNGRIEGTVTNPWTGHTSVSVMLGNKPVASGQVTGVGPSLSDHQLYLLPSYVMDYNVSPVPNKLHGIATTVGKHGSTGAVADVVVKWVESHIHNAKQAQTERADQTLSTMSGNQASKTALAVALLRANNIPAKAAKSQVTKNGMYGTSYRVDAWIGGKWVDVGTP